MTTSETPVLIFRVDAQVLERRLRNIAKVFSLGKRGASVYPKGKVALEVADGRATLTLSAVGITTLSTSFDVDEVIEPGGIRSRSEALRQDDSHVQGEDRGLEGHRGAQDPLAGGRWGGLDPQ